MQGAAFTPALYAMATSASARLDADRSQGELPEPAKIALQAGRPAAAGSQISEVGRWPGPGLAGGLGRQKRLKHAFSAPILVSRAKVKFAGPFLQLDAPSAAPGWPVKSRSACPALSRCFSRCFPTNGVARRRVTGTAGLARCIEAQQQCCCCSPCCCSLPSRHDERLPCDSGCRQQPRETLGHSISSGDCCPGSERCAAE